MSQRVIAVTGIADEPLAAVKFLRNIRPGIEILRDHGPVEPISPRDGERVGQTIVAVRLANLCQAATELEKRDVQFQIIVFLSSELLKRAPQLKSECGWFYLDELEEKRAAPNRRVA